MLKRFVLVAAVAGFALLGFSSTAGAATIGSTAFIGPPFPCSSTAGTVFIQSQSDPSAPYYVPAGGGVITQFSTNTTGGTPGRPVIFLVLRPAGSGSYTVVGTDTETITSSSGVQTFNVASPITAQAGDVLGLYSGTAASPSGVICFSGAFSPTPTPVTNGVSAAPSAAVPVPGQTFTATQLPAPFNIQLNVAATVVQDDDVAVTTSASNGVLAGQPALLPSTVINNGPGSSPITFTDRVPAGLSISGVAAGNGSCSVSGQTVTCTISGLASGQSAAVSVVVRAAKPGRYVNSVSVAPPPGINDLNPGNNTASATLSVAGAQAAPAKCVVPNLKGVPRSTAARVLRLLSCRVGQDKHAHSSRVAKGRVIGTSRRAGSYAARTVVRLTVSTGPVRPRRRTAPAFTG